MSSISGVTKEVLQTIRYNRKPISKATLVRRTNYSLATVTDHVDRLLTSNLIVEKDEGPSTGGRKPRLLSFNSKAGYALAIDLESTRVQVGITDLNCKILVSQESSSIDVSQGPKVVLDTIKEIVFALVSQLGISKSDILGIGMGLPGPVEYSKGMPLSLSIMPGWNRYPVKEYWENYFDCNCYVDNNVYTMALGEYTLNGKFEKGMENQIFLKIGNGIGIGIICQGQIYRGASESAGQVGHTDIGHNKLCYCGNRGCLEAIAGARAIARRAEEMAESGISPYLEEIFNKENKLTIDDVLKAVEESDAAMVEFIRDCGNKIGKVVGSFVNFFNPSCIIIGGSVSNVGDVLLASIRQAIYQSSLPLTTRTLVINHSKLGGKAGIIGAAALTIDKVIENIYEKKLKLISSL